MMRRGCNRVAAFWKRSKMDKYPWCLLLVKAKVFGTGFSIAQDNIVCSCSGLQGRQHLRNQSRVVVCYRVMVLIGDRDLRSSPGGFGSFGYNGLYPFNDHFFII